MPNPTTLTFAEVAAHLQALWDLLKAVGVLGLAATFVGWRLKARQAEQAARAALAVDISTTRAAFEVLHEQFVEQCTLLEGRAPQVASGAASPPLTNAEAIGFLRSLRGGFIANGLLGGVPKLLGVLKAVESNCIVRFDDNVRLFFEVERRYAANLAVALQRAGSAPPQATCDEVVLEYIDRSASHSRTLQARAEMILKTGLEAEELGLLPRMGRGEGAGPKQDSSSLGLAGIDSLGAPGPEGGPGRVSGRERS